MATNVIGAPRQETMASPGDLFGGATQIYIRQEMAVIELCGCEAKQRYRISVPSAPGQEGSVFLYISEDSECLERICCGPNRTLTLKVHQGATNEGAVVQRMHKPFSCQGCCCLRPTFRVTDHANAPVGNIEDPCRCCWIDQRVFDNKNNMIFTMDGSPCQPGACCPLCLDMNFHIKKQGNKVGGLTKHRLDVQDCCMKTNRFTVDFGSANSDLDKRMMLASAMLLDLEYFEQQK